MSFQLVEDLQQKAITVSQACRVLDVSRSGYTQQPSAARQHPWCVPTARM